MFLEINDISTGSVITEPLNMYTVASVYEKPVGSKYRIIYRLTNGIIKEEEFDTKSAADSRINDIKEIGGASTNVYTYKGSCLFANKPSSGQVAGDVWNIEDDFTLDGKNYPAGTNIAWDGTNWDPLAGSMVAGGLEFKGVCTMNGTGASNAILFDGKEPGIYFFCTAAAGANNFENVYVKGTSSDPGTMGMGQGMAIVVIVKSFNDAAIDEVFAYSYCSPTAGINTLVISMQRSIIEIKKKSATEISMPSVITRKLSKDNIDYTDMVQTIDAKKTFSTLPEVSSSSPSYSNIKQFVAKGYVDVSRNYSLTKEYDPAKAYKIGDYMFKSDSGSNPYLYIYKCKLNTPVPAGNYNSTYWDRMAYYEADTLNLIPPKPVWIETDITPDSGGDAPVEDATLLATLNSIKDDYVAGKYYPVNLKIANDDMGYDVIRVCFNASIYAKADGTSFYLVFHTNHNGNASVITFNYFNSGWTWQEIIS